MIPEKLDPETAEQETEMEAVFFLHQAGDIRPGRSKSVETDGVFDPQANKDALENQVEVYPNPFNPVTTIRFHLHEPSEINLAVFDLEGRLVATLLDGYREQGLHSARFDAAGLATGVYIYRLSVNGAIRSGVITLMK